MATTTATTCAMCRTYTAPWCTTDGPPPPRVSGAALPARYVFCFEYSCVCDLLNRYTSFRFLFSFAQVLIYNGDEHAALAIGNCLLDQHNPARCGSGAQWGSNIVLKP